MDMTHLRELQDISYTMLERTTIDDVSKITLDKATSILERVEKLIDEVKNPYIMKCGNTIVEVMFSKNDKTIDSQIKTYVKAIKKADSSCES